MDIYDYKARLLAKLEAVESVIAEMGEPAPKGKRGRPAGTTAVSGNGRKKRKPLSAATKKKMAEAAKKRWADRKAAAK